MARRTTRQFVTHPIVRRTRVSGRPSGGDPHRCGDGGKDNPPVRDASNSAADEGQRSPVRGAEDDHRWATEGHERRPSTGRPGAAHHPQGSEETCPPGRRRTMVAGCRRRRTPAPRSPASSWRRGPPSPSATRSGSPCGPTGAWSASASAPMPPHVAGRPLEWHDWRHAPAACGSTTCSPPSRPPVSPWCWRARSSTTHRRRRTQGPPPSAALQRPRPGRRSGSTTQTPERPGRCAPCDPGGLGRRGARGAGAGWVATLPSAPAGAEDERLTDVVVLRREHPGRRRRAGMDDRGLTRVRAAGRRGSAR